jgi:hypothetical protein
MGALTGNAIKDTYLDVVQLGKSGAGLPSHAGKEAALYDGSGAQILGRTAVRHWLDPHPDAASFAETWEFSTKGAMTQTQLEAAGWTFANCTGVVSQGLLKLTASSTAIATASLAVSFAGDFDLACSIIKISNYNEARVSTTAPSECIGGFGVADTVNNESEYLLQLIDSGRFFGYAMKTGAWTTLAGTGATAAPDYSSYPNMLRIVRDSSTVNYLVGSPYGSQLTTTANQYYSWTKVTQTSSRTFNKLFLTFSSGNALSGGIMTVPFLRRFE